MAETNSPSSPPSLETGRLTARSLSKAVFDAELPEQFIRTIPAQSLYLAVRQNSLESSIDLIEIATIEQVRLMFDFDLWNKDEFSEDRFFEWIALTEEGGDLSVIQKVLKCLDLKLIGVLISKYLDVITYDDGADAAPGAGFYTPDKGFTWVQIKIPDATRHFLFARFLALLFETSADLFYQLLALPGRATVTELEEESFQERGKRLEAEGVPLAEHAAKLHAPISVAEVKILLEKADHAPIVQDVPIIEPLVFENASLEPFGSFLQSPPEGFAEELTLLMNAAIVKYSVDFGQQDEVALLAQKVRGAINIGLQKSFELALHKDIQSIYSILGLQKLYRLGLTLIGEVKKASKVFTDEKLKHSDQESAVFAIVAGAREAFPCMPKFFLADGTLDASSGSLQSGFKAIELEQERLSLIKWLNSAANTLS